MQLLQPLQTVPQTTEKLVQTQAQGPKAANGFRRTQSVVIAAHQFLKISKQGFDGPSQGHGVDHAYRISSILWDDTEVTEFASLVSRASQIQALGQ